MKKVLIVGQTPPPYGGQAIIIEYILRGNYKNIKLHHVRMNFSKEMNERGKLSLYKITHVFSIIFKILSLKFKYNIDTLYYPPSNSPKISIYRDVFILFFTRFFFKKTIYHFHAAGISEELPKMKHWKYKLFYWILQKPDLAITNSKFNPLDGEFLQAKRTVIIPYGVPDDNPYPEEKDYKKNIMKILFVGLLNSTKGEGYALDAINILNKKGYEVKFLLAGKFESDQYKKYFFEKVKDYNLQKKVEYRGVVTGEVKRHLFLESDIFCFPSFFVSESFGIVLLEAMQYQLPLIATRWRGIQSIVKPNENGLLVDIKSANQIAEALMYLFENKGKLEEFSKTSRKLYLKNHNMQNYWLQIEKSFLDV